MRSPGLISASVTRLASCFGLTKCTAAEKEDRRFINEAFRNKAGCARARARIALVSGRRSRNGGRVRYRPISRTVPREFLLAREACSRGTHERGRCSRRSRPPPWYRSSSLLPSFFASAVAIPSLLRSVTLAISRTRLVSVVGARHRRRFDHYRICGETLVDTLRISSGKLIEALSAFAAADTRKPRRRKSSFSR